MRLGGWFLLVAIGVCIAGGRARADELVPLASPDLALRWDRPAAIRLALWHGAGRLITAGATPDGVAVALLDTAAHGLIAAATAAGLNSDTRLLDLAVGPSGLAALAWAAPDGSSETTRGDGVRLVDVNNGALAATLDEPRFLLCAFDASTDTLWGVAGPAEEDNAYRIAAYAVVDGTTSSEPLPRRTDEYLPRDLVLNAERARLHILWDARTAGAPERIDTYRLPDGALLASATLSAVALRRGAMALLPDDGGLVVAPQCTGCSIPVFAPETLTRAADIPTAALGPAFRLGGPLAVDGQTRELLLAGADHTPVDQALAVLPLATPEAAAFVALPAPAVAMALEHGARRLFVAHEDPQQISVVSLARRAVTARVDVNARPVALAAHPHGLDVLATGGGLYRLGGAPTQLQERLALATSSDGFGLLADPARRRLYASRGLAAAPLALDLLTAETVGELPAPARALALDPTGGVLYALPFSWQDETLRHRVRVIGATDLQDHGGVTFEPAARVYSVRDPFYRAADRELLGLRPLSPAGSRHEVVRLSFADGTVAVLDAPPPLATFARIAYDEASDALCAAGMDDAGGIYVAVRQLREAAPWAVSERIEQAADVIALQADPGQGLAYVLAQPAPGWGEQALVLVCDWRAAPKPVVAAVHTAPFYPAHNALTMHFDAARNRLAVAGQLPSVVWLLEAPAPLARRPPPPELGPPNIALSLFHGQARIALPSPALGTAGFRLERAAEQGEFLALAPFVLPAGLETYWDVDLAPGQVWRYRARAVATDGRISAPGPEAVVQGDAATAGPPLLYPFDAVLRLRPGESAQTTVQVTAPPSYQRAELRWKVMNDDGALTCQLSPSRLHTPGVAQLALAAAANASAGQRHIIIRALRDGVESNAVIAVEIVPRVNGPSTLGRRRVMRRPLSMSIASDATLMEASGAWITVKGALGLPDGAAQATAVDLVFTSPSGNTMRTRGVVAANGRFARSLRIDEPGVWRVRASWLGDGTHAGALSNPLPLPLHAPPSSTRGLRADNIALIVSAGDRGDKAGVIDDVVRRLIDGLVDLRYTRGTRIQALARETTADALEATSEDVRAALANNRTAGLLLVYLLGAAHYADGDWCVDLARGTRLCARELAAWLPADQQAVVIVDARAADAFLEPIRLGAGAASKAVIAASLRPYSYASWPLFSQVFVPRALQLPLGDAYALTRAAALVDTLDLPPHGATWNLEAFRHVQLGSAFVAPAVPLRDREPPHITAVSPVAEGAVGQPLWLWIEGYDLPEPAAALSGELRWWWQGRADDVYTANLSLAGARLGATILPDRAGFLRAVLTLRDAAGNTAAAGLTVAVLGDVGVYDCKTNRRIDADDLPCLRAAARVAAWDWMTWFDVARHWHAESAP